MRVYVIFHQIQKYFIIFYLMFLKNHKNIMEIIILILMNNYVKFNNFY